MSLALRCSSVQIDGELRAPADDFGSLRRKNRIDIRVTGEDRRERVLDDDCDLEVRAGLFGQSKRGGGEHAVAQGSQANHRDARAGRQAL